MVAALTLSPPVLGWNTKDPISAMDPLYAVECENYYSNGGTVDLRKGTAIKATNVGNIASINLSVFGFSKADGSTKIVCVDGHTGKPWDVTAGGAAPTDLSAGGAKLVGPNACTGVVFRNRLFMKALSTSKDVWDWDGAAASVNASTFTGPGGDDKAIFNPQVYKSRLYFVGDDASFWYGGIDAITGALTQFDVQSFLTLGGRLLFAGGVTSVGSNIDNYFACVSDQGEVLLYQGDFPGASNWALIGHYYGPRPVGYRSFFYWGPSLVVITYQGVVLLSEVMRGGGSLSYLTDKISDRFVELISTAGADTWANGVYYPNGNFILINLPGTDYGSMKQVVMSTVNGSWWYWTGIPAYHWAVAAGGLYFCGEPNAVYQAWTGEYDQLSNGAVRSKNSVLRPAFHYLGDREGTKRFIQARPIVYESQGLNIVMGADIDYADTTPSANDAFTDTTDTSYKQYKPQIPIQGTGQAISCHFEQTITTKKRSIHGVQVLFEPGAEVPAGVLL